MEKILTVSGSEQEHEVLQRLLKKMKLSSSHQVNNGLEARRVLQTTPFQLVIVNMPLPDEQGEAIARLAFANGAQVILLTKNEQIDIVWEQICSTGIYLIPKPLKRAVFFQTVQCILLQQEALQQLQAEKEKLRRQIQDANLLNRAKLVLMQVLKLSEPQAHHYIEKQAMDLRISKRDVAEGIINTYEN